MEGEFLYSAVETSNLSLGDLFSTRWFSCILRAIILHPWQSADWSDRAVNVQRILFLNRTGMDRIATDE